MILWLQVGAWPLKSWVSPVFLQPVLLLWSSTRFITLWDLGASVFCTSSHQRGVTTHSLYMAFFFSQAEQSCLVRPIMFAGLWVRSTMSRKKSYSLGSSDVFIITSVWTVIQEILARCSSWCSLLSSSAEASGLDAVLMKWLCCIGELLPSRWTLQEQKKPELRAVCWLNAG